MSICRLILHRASSIKSHWALWSSAKQTLRPLEGFPYPHLTDATRWIYLSEYDCSHCRKKFVVVIDSFFVQRVEEPAINIFPLWIVVCGFGIQYEVGNSAFYCLIGIFIDLWFVISVFFVQTRFFVSSIFRVLERKKYFWLDTHINKKNITY